MYLQMNDSLTWKILVSVFGKWNLIQGKVILNQINLFVRGPHLFLNITCSDLNFIFQIGYTKCVHLMPPLTLKCLRLTYNRNRNYQLKSDLIETLPNILNLWLKRKRKPLFKSQKKPIKDSLTMLSTLPPPPCKVCRSSTHGQTAGTYTRPRWSVSWTSFYMTPNVDHIFGLTSEHNILLIWNPTDTFDGYDFFVDGVRYKDSHDCWNS